jgi:hypothetical protein
MVTALTSFAFSALALILSGAAFGWQVLSWFLTGGRIKIEFKAGAIGPPGITTMSKVSRAEISSLRRQGYNDIAGVIEIHNKGRMAAFVDKVGIETGDALFRDTEPASGKELPYKLEAGERAKWAIRGWSIDSAQASTQVDERAPSVRAFVMLSSGKRRISKKSAHVRKALTDPGE